MSTSNVNTQFSSEQVSQLTISRSFSRKGSELTQLFQNVVFSEETENHPEMQNFLTALGQIKQQEIVRLYPSVIALFPNDAKTITRRLGQSAPSKVIADIEEKDSAFDIEEALLGAITVGNVEVAQYLLFKVNSDSRYFDAFFQMAAREGHISILNAVLARACEYRISIFNFSSRLISAAIEGNHLKAVKWVLANYAKIQALDSCPDEDRAQLRETLETEIRNAHENGQEEIAQECQKFLDAPHHSCILL